MAGLVFLGDLVDAFTISYKSGRLVCLRGHFSKRTVFEICKGYVDDEQGRGMTVVGLNKESMVRKCHDTKSGLCMDRRVAKTKRDDKQEERKVIIAHSMGNVQNI